MGSSSMEVLLEDDFATLAPADFCALPGYLLLRIHGGAQSMAQLGAVEARRVGALLAAATLALETVLGADRVYTLSFCEVDRRLHFHLFPRTDELLAAYHLDTGTQGEDVDGPRLFQWARERYPAGHAPPWATDPATLSRNLRAFLGKLDLEAPPGRK